MFFNILLFAPLDSCFNYPARPGEFRRLCALQVPGYGYVHLSTRHPFATCFSRRVATPKLMFGWNFYHLSAISWMWLSKISAMYLSMSFLPTKSQQPKTHWWTRKLQGPTQQMKKKWKNQREQTTRNNPDKDQSAVSCFGTIVWANSFVQTEDGWKDTLFFLSPWGVGKTQIELHHQIFT